MHDSTYLLWEFEGVRESVENALLFLNICTGFPLLRWACFQSLGLMSPRVCCAPVGDIHFVCDVAGNSIPYLHSHQSKACLPPELLCLPAPRKVGILLMLIDYMSLLIVC